jgi:hypothetical protein
LIPKSVHPHLVEACILSREFETRVHAFWRRSDVSFDEKRQFVNKMLQLRNERWQAYLNSGLGWADFAQSQVRSANRTHGSRDGE